MADDDLVTDPQHGNVGLLLKTRRQSHQVSIGDLIGKADPDASLAMAAAEAYENPPAECVRIWYTALISAVAIKASWQKQSYAERNQWWSTNADRDLWHTAIRGGNRIAWWWGARKLVSPRGAWCYLCNEMIHPYDVSSGVSHPARSAVMAHRATHIQQLGRLADTMTLEENV